MIMDKQEQCYLPVNDERLAVSFEEDKQIAAFWNMTESGDADE